MSNAALWSAFAATWPPARMERRGGWTIRDGQGGGKRVSAASGAGDIAAAEAAMRNLEQVPMFALRGDDPLDGELETRGYVVMDPVTIYTAPAETLAAFAPDAPLVYEVWPPLAIMEEIWAEGGVGPERIAVMERASSPKTALLGRIDGRAAAVAFVAIHDGLAFLHALEVAPHARKRGVGKQMMGQAGRWAAQNGAATLSLAVTDLNVAGNALYTSIGMTPVDTYHYRVIANEKVDAC